VLDAHRRGKTLGSGAHPGQLLACCSSLDSPVRACDQRRPVHHRPITRAWPIAVFSRWADVSPVSEAHLLYRQVLPIHSYLNTLPRFSYIFMFRRVLSTPSSYCSISLQDLDCMVTRDTAPDLPSIAPLPHLNQGDGPTSGQMPLMRSGPARRKSESTPPRRRSVGGGAGRHVPGITRRNASHGSSSRSFTPKPPGVCTAWAEHRLQRDQQTLGDIVLKSQPGETWFSSAAADQSARATRRVSTSFRPWPPTNNDIMAAHPCPPSSLPIEIVRENRFFVLCKHRLTIETKKTTAVVSPPAVVFFLFSPIVVVSWPVSCLFAAGCRANSPGKMAPIGSLLPSG